MRIVVTGAEGQLGRALVAEAGEGLSVHPFGRTQLDISNPDAVAACIEGLKPDAVINAAAYTAVDRAEAEPERAHAVNAVGARNLAGAAHACEAHFLQVSTDFVFDGRTSTPYSPDHDPAPLSTYGRTKREGEIAVMEATEGAATIVRTSWLYAPSGSNFVRTVLRLLSERECMSVVCDQIAAPTHATGLAQTLLCLATQHRAETRGQYLHWADAGAASWFDVAECVRLLAGRRWPGRQWGRVQPIPTSEFPTPAQRPAFSLLDSSATRALVGNGLSWQEALSRALLKDPAAWWLP